jgi:hypothetical protein
LLFGALVLAAACGPAGPTHYPVTGRVVSESEGGVPKSLVKQTVEFQCAAEPQTRAFGEIQPDGSFTLSTWRQGQGNVGVIAGTHKGRIIVEIAQEDQVAARKRKPVVDAKYTRFDTTPWTIEVPAAEPVVLKVP